MLNTNQAPPSPRPLPNEFPTCQPSHESPTWQPSQESPMSDAEYYRRKLLEVQKERDSAVEELKVGSRE